jgi:predicted ATPase
MNGFKLLAIRPLENCADHFTKVLTKGIIYRLHNDYHFKDINGSTVTGYEEVDSIEFSSTNDIGLFDLVDSNGKVECNINISAIVGKNGSGKSSLIELLLLAKYQLGCIFELLEKTVKDSQPKEKCNTCGQDIPKSQAEIKKRFYKVSDLKHGFSAEFYFTRENLLYILKFDEQATYFDEYNFVDNAVYGLNGRSLGELTKKKRSLLSEVFYSIVLNYSIYGLNASHIGTWINPLFHKNDGYRTPIVLNPMRNNGKFDVNREEHLNKQRLLSNLIFKNAKNSSDHSLTDELYIQKLEFNFDKKTFDERNEKRGGFLHYYSISKEQYMFICVTFRSFLSTSNINVPKLFEEYLITYLVDKSIKIAQKYPEYRLLNLLQSDSPILWTDFFKILASNNSHTTFKFRQTYNFMKSGILNQFIDENDSEKSRDWILQKNITKPDSEIYTYQIPLEDLTKLVLNAAGNNYQEIIYFLPSAIFSSDLFIYKKGDTNKTFKLSSLSSGENQLIAALQTCYYHLLNLESIHWSNSAIITTREDERNEPVPYKSVNIVFDEIELYFHPEYQRQFIANLITGIGLLPLNKIKQLNIIFSTHSPFILSDIPAQNILRLDLNKDGKSEPQPMKEQTFGANIHHLLANDFFLSNGFIGEFASKKINCLISFLRSEELENAIWNESNSYQMIELIGDELIKNTLITLYYHKFQQKLEEKIKQLTALRK